MIKHSYDIGVIGNCSYMGHIRMDTNIVWMCWPKFDSSFIFGSLLDKEKGGDFSILPHEGSFDSRQYYVENTNVLCTEIKSTTGIYRVTDFAPRFVLFERNYRPTILIRKIEAVSGTPSILVRCNPKNNYGEITPKSFYESNQIHFLGMDGDIRLTTNISLSYIEEERFFVLNEPKYLVLTYGTPLTAPIERTCEDYLKRTVDYWQLWVKSMSLGDFFQEMVIRSSLVLKIHQFEDTGGFIASATTSLPESPGSTRNWDYRYCWLRDAYYILTAFNHIGHFEELEGYFNYIANISIKEDERYQPLYSITGRKTLSEIELPLNGYLGNKPVRIGNDAFTHIQNDVYGQVLLSLLLLYVDHRFIYSERTESHKLVYSVLKKIDETMDESDAGLWEFRTLSQKHCYTYLFHWAGSLAGIKISKFLKDKKLENYANSLKKRAMDGIELCYNSQQKAYMNAIGSNHVDASTLQMICMSYLDPHSEHAKNHLLLLEKELKTQEGLVYRYRHFDDFGNPESTFMICSFWYVEALACVGRIDESISIFESLLKFSNHLGLLSEDVDTHNGSQWGNFPQAYSHVGLVNAAFRISNKIDKPNFL